jgi:hypothetical protein
VIENYDGKEMKSASDYDYSEGADQKKFEDDKNYISNGNEGNVATRFMQLLYRDATEQRNEATVKSAVADVLLTVLPIGRILKVGTRGLRQYNSVESLIAAAGKLTKVGGNKSGAMQGFVIGNSDDIFAGLASNYGAVVKLGKKGQKYFTSGKIRVDITPDSRGGISLRLNISGKLYKIRVNPE